MLRLKSVDGRIDRWTPVRKDAVRGVTGFPDKSEAHKYV